MKKVARWEEIVDGRFEKGFIIAGPLGCIYNYIWPRGKPSGLTRVGRSMSLPGPDGRAQARSWLMRTIGSEEGGRGFGAGDEGLRPLDGRSTSRGIQNKRSRPLLSSASTSSGLDSRSGNPSISRRVGRASRLGSKGALLSRPLSGLVDIAAPTVMKVPPETPSHGGIPDRPPLSPF
jgi:hypothetical protein